MKSRYKMVCYCSKVAIISRRDLRVFFCSSAGITENGGT